MVYTVVPSECYAPKGETTQCLLQALVNDVNMLHEEGIEASDYKTKFG